jgi:hypothetical protein
VSKNPTCDYPTVNVPRWATSTKFGKAKEVKLGEHQRTVQFSLSTFASDSSYSSRYPLLAHILVSQSSTPGYAQRQEEVVQPTSSMLILMKRYAASSNFIGNAFLLSPSSV